ncbi:hypothetical protein [Prosthecomicrobium sp. N25]|uniref:hypothetical protein n=1 Tax=Prosthecomicrobium sp. N25 TaxID=3129254 RepID=UPI003076A2FC
MKNFLLWAGSGLITLLRAHWRGLVFTSCHPILAAEILRVHLGHCLPSIVSVGIGLAIVNLAQGRDLIYDGDLAWTDWVAFGVLTALFWAAPVHLSARLRMDAVTAVNRPPRGILGDPQPLYDVTALRLWIARDLGLLTILILVFAGWVECRTLGTFPAKYWIPPATTEVLLDARRQLCAFVACTSAVLVAYVIYVTSRRPLVNKVSSTWTLRAILNLYWFASVVLIIFAAFWPFAFAESFSRLSLLPILCGAWVAPYEAIRWLASGRPELPRSGEGARWILRGSVSGKSYGLPLRAGITILLGFLLWSWAVADTRFHDARSLDGKSSRAERQITVADAIATWKDANGCPKGPAPGPGRYHAHCKALLVAADGGASRAAFQVATVMGALIDESAVDQGSRHPEVLRRLFLMSGVSGGAFGVATLRAALTAAPTDMTPPCGVETNTPRAPWYKQGSKSAERSSWRECLQKLVSGDYLTPAVTGLAMRDWWLGGLANVGVRLEDRSALLETAMERHFAKVACKPDTNAPCGLDRPFGYAGRPTSARPPEGDGRPLWTPLLTLNATAVGSGRPILFSDLQLTRPVATAGSPSPFDEAFPTALDFFELRAAYNLEPMSSGFPRDGTLDDANNKDKVPDIRISTAIVASARFPVLSAEGVIRSVKTEKIVEKFVDGGYFDNSGLTSLLPIILALQKEGVEPVVLHIGNAPIALPPRSMGSDAWFRLPGRTGILQPFVPSFWSPYSAVASSLLTLDSSRSGHVEAAKQAVMASIGQDRFVFAGVAERVRTAPKLGPSMVRCPLEKGRYRVEELSMSWWLSSLVQGYIDLQLCAEGWPVADGSGGAEDTPCDGSSTVAPNTAIARVLGKIESKRAPDRASGTACTLTGANASHELQMREPQFMQ